MTPRQAEALAFIKAFLAEWGYPPSIKEIAHALGLRSTSTIAHHLEGLAKRGLIRWDKGKNRAIQLLGTEVCAACGGTGRAHKEATHG